MCAPSLTLPPRPSNRDCDYAPTSCRIGVLISVILALITAVLFFCSQTENIRNAQLVSVIHPIVYWVSLCARDGAKKWEFLAVGLIREVKPKLFGQNTPVSYLASSDFPGIEQSCTSVQTFLEPFLIVTWATFVPGPCFECVEGLMFKWCFLAINWRETVCRGVASVSVIVPGLQFQVWQRAAKDSWKGRWTECWGFNCGPGSTCF